MTKEFPKRVRLLRASEFERVFAARASASDGSMVVHGAANELGHPRLGLVVSRRMGSAVRRNRWKRLLREGFRVVQDQLPALDLVGIPRAATPPPLESIQASYLQLAARIERPLPQLVLRWIVRQPGITGCIVGASRRSQIAQNVVAFEGDIAQSIFDRFTAISDQVMQHIPERDRIYVS